MNETHVKPTAVPLAQRPARVSRLPMYKSFDALLGVDGELREVAPRRYVDSGGVVHFIATAALKKAVEVGVLHDLGGRCYRLGERPSV